MEINVNKWIRLLDDGESALVGRGASTQEAIEMFNYVAGQPAVRLVSDSNSDAVIAHFKEYGAWFDLDFWSDAALNALLLQDVEHAFMELCDYCRFVYLDIDEYDDTGSGGCECSGRLWRCDIEGHKEYGQWFYYLGF